MFLLLPTTSIIHYIFFAGLGKRAKEREGERGQRRERKWRIWGSNTEIKRARERGTGRVPSLSSKVCSLEEVQREEEKGGLVKERA